MSPQLNQSARSHAEDMATNGCFQHDSCDGTALVHPDPELLPPSP